MASEYIISGSLVLDVGDASRKLTQVKDGTKAVETQTKDSSDKIERDWEKIGKKIGNVGSKMTTRLTLPILGLAAAAVKFASDQEESLSKVDVVFQDSADEVKAWSSTTIDKFGIAKSTALEMASLFGDMGVSMGLPRDEAALMAMNLSGLAGDLASFKNISLERAQVALAGIYTGETEALKGLGIVMNETNLAAFAQAEGATKSWKEMDQAEKVAWRYKFVMSATADAQGDFARTSDSVSNQSRVAQERMKELAAEFGENLLPIVSQVLGVINDLLKAFTNTDESTQNAILWGLGIVAAVGPVVKIVGSVVENIGKVSAAFSTGGLSLATLGWVGAAIAVVAGIAAIVLSVKAHYDEIYADATALNNAMTTLKETMINSEKDYQAETDNIFATADAAKAYLDRLTELEKQGKLSAEEQLEYNTTLQALQKTMPGLNILIDEQTGKIKGGTTAIYDQIDAWVDLAVGEAMLKKQETQINAVADARIALAEAEKNEADNKKVLNDLMARETELWAGITAATGKTREEIEALNVSDAANFWRTAGAEAQAYRLELNQEVTPALKDTALGQEALNTAITEAEVELDAANAQLLDTTKSTQEYQLAQENAQKATGDATGTIDENTDALGNNATAADEAGESVKNYANDVVSANDKIELDNEVTAKSLMETAQQNLNIQKDTQMNMTQLTSRGVSDAWLASLYDMGDKGWSQIRAMNKMTDEQLAEYVKLWEEAGGDANLEYKDGIWQIVEETEEAVEAASNVDTSGIGADMGQGVANGIDSKIEAVKAAAKRLVNAASGTMKVTQEISSPSKKTAREIGGPMAEGIAVGFEDKLRAMMGKLKTSTSGIVSGLTSGSADVASQAKVSSQNMLREVLVGKQAASVVQNNTFTTQTLSPYEQRVQLYKMDKDLAEVLA